MINNGKKPFENVITSMEIVGFEHAAPRVTLCSFFLLHAANGTSCVFYFVYFPLMYFWFGFFSLFVFWWQPCWVGFNVSMLRLVSDLQLEHKWQKPHEIKTTKETTLRYRVFFKLHEPSHLSKTISCQFDKSLCFVFFFLSLHFKDLWSWHVIAAIVRHHPDRLR